MQKIYVSSVSPQIQQCSTVIFILGSNVNFYQDSVTKDSIMQNEVLMFSPLHTSGTSFHYTKVALPECQFFLQIYI